MITTRSSRILMLTLSLCLLATSALANPRQVASLDISTQSVLWSPLTTDPMVLTISGPSGDFRFEVDAGETATFDIFDQDGALLQDGSYTWQIITLPTVHEATREAIQRTRAEGVPFNGTLPEGFKQSGAFRVQNGYFVLPTHEAVERPAGTVTPNKDQVIDDDLIATRSACIGEGCADGEEFGFNTLLLKEDNLRIQFEDTSNSGSYPSNDWELVANDTENGGANRFSIEDLTGNLTPFTIKAGAPSDSLYVDDSGLIGLGTATPTAEIHLAHGNSPTIRLEQDGSKGLTSQIWDMAGNEAHWSVRDVTHDSTPLKIYPNAPTDSLVIGTDGDLGVGTALPEVALDVLRNNGTAQLRIQEMTSSPGTYSLINLKTTSTGNVRPRFTMTHGGTAFGETTWNFDILNTSGDFAIIRGGPGGPVLTFDAHNGNLSISELGNSGAVSGDIRIPGRFISNGTPLTVPDYVFAEDYDLMPLDEVQTFINEKHHLPEVPSAAEVQAEGLDLTNMQLTLLKKVEELTLYTLDQHETIRELRSANQDQQAIIQRLTERLEAVEAALR